MANFDHNIIGEYGQDLIEEMTTPGKLNSGEVLDYGFGLITKIERGLKTIGHNGAWAGYLSEVIRFPDRRFSVICLSNLSNINLGKLARQISDIYLAESFTEPFECLINEERQFIGLSTAELETKTGLYFNAKSGRSWELAIQDQKLMVDTAGFNFQIMPIGQDYYHSVGFFYDINIKFEQQNLQSPVMISFWVEGGKLTSLEKLSPYTPTLDRLLDYAGEYFCDELEIKYQLSIKDGNLIMNRKSCPPDLLKPLYHNSFKGMYNSFEFICDDRDRVLGLNLNGVGSGRIRSIYFIKQ